MLSIKLINPRRIPDQTPVIVCERVARLKKKEKKKEREIQRKTIRTEASKALREN